MEIQVFFDVVAYRRDQTTIVTKRYKGLTEQCQGKILQPLDTVLIAQSLHFQYKFLCYLIYSFLYLHLLDLPGLPLFQFH